jgi:hypothetical protein
MTPLQTASKLPAHTGAIRLRSVSAITECITSRNVTLQQSITHKVLVSRMLRSVNCSCLQKEQKDSKNLKDLRDRAVFAFFMINTLFVLVILMLQLSSDQLHIQWPFASTNISSTNGTGHEVYEVRVYALIYTYIYM